MQRTVVFGLMALLVVALVGCRESQETTTPPAPVAWTADGIISDGEYSGGVGENNYELFWRRDGDDILIGMRAEAEGWVAVAFGPQPLHAETDSVIGYVTAAGASVFDMYSTGPLGPCVADTELGGSDDIIEFAGREADGVTVIEFRRSLNTGDEYDGVLNDGVNEVLWAYSNHDDPADRHLYRGELEIALP